MGMTDSQFKAFVRFLLSAMKDAQSEEDGTKKAEKYNKIMDNLQETLED